MIQEIESSSWWHAGPYSVLPTVENMFTALKEEKKQILHENVYLSRRKNQILHELIIFSCIDLFTSTKYSIHTLFL